MGASHLSAKSCTHCFCSLWVFSFKRHDPNPNPNLTATNQSLLSLRWEWPAGGAVPSWPPCDLMGHPAPLDIYSPLTCTHSASFLSLSVSLTHLSSHSLHSGSFIRNASSLSSSPSAHPSPGVFPLSLETRAGLLYCFLSSPWGPSSDTYEPRGFSRLLFEHFEACTSGNWDLGRWSISRWVLVAEGEQRLRGVGPGLSPSSQTSEPGGRAKHFCQWTFTFTLADLDFLRISTWSHGYFGSLDLSPLWLWGPKVIEIKAHLFGC